MYVCMRAWVCVLCTHEKALGWHVVYSVIALHLLYWIWLCSLTCSSLSALIWLSSLLAELLELQVSCRTPGFIWILGIPTLVTTFAQEALCPLSRLSGHLFVQQFRWLLKKTGSNASLSTKSLNRYLLFQNLIARCLLLLLYTKASCFRWVLNVSAVMFKISKLIRSVPWSNCSSSNTSEQGNLSPHFPESHSPSPFPKSAPRFPLPDMFFPIAAAGRNSSSCFTAQHRSCPPLTKLLPMLRGGSHLTVPFLMYRTTEGEKSQLSAKPPSQRANGSQWPLHYTTVPPTPESEHEVARLFWDFCLFSH